MKRHNQARGRTCETAAPRFRANLGIHWRWPILVLAIACSAVQFGKPSPRSQAAEPSRLGSVNSVAVAAELKTVKLYGAGGFAGLDSYQSGFFVSDEGYILTVWSTVLDVDKVIAVTSDGSRLEAELLGIDPNLEIAVLATNRGTNNYFDLSDAAEPRVGTRVIALSNLFGIAAGNEMASVQRGVVMALTELNARRGAFESVYQGPVLIIDALTNNPGAGGGALVDLNGKIAGMLGKELRDTNANIWLNYAIPIQRLQASVENLIAGKSIVRAAENRPVSDRPADLRVWGIALVPDVLTKTPAYVDLVAPGSPAARAGLENDDLILFLNSLRVASQSVLRAELKYVDRGDEVALLVQRGSELKEIIIAP